MAYINLKLCPVDNGRVLGCDHTHGYRLRHCMGTVEPAVFATYAELAERFYKEVFELWRMEDGEG